MASSPARKPRFRRCADGIPPVRLTPRDTEIMRQISAHRFLRSPQIVSLVGGSAQQIVRRLQLLFHHGYLERPRAQIDTYHQSGSQPMVYGLASRGAAHLRRVLDLPFDRIDWTRKNTAIGRFFLDHALMTSEITVAFDLAARDSGSLRFVSREALNASVEAGEFHKDIFGWDVAMPDDPKAAGVVPDQTFALADRSEAGLLTFYFLEADRGTMPVERSDRSQSCLAKKIANYSATWQQNLHRDRLGIHRFRVLIVTTSKDRVGNIVAACTSLSRGHGLFLFTDIDSLRASGNPLNLQWVNARGDPESLVSG